MRSTSMPLNVTSLPVGTMPISSPWWVLSATGGGYSGVDAGTLVTDSNPAQASLETGQNPRGRRVQWINDATPDDILVEVVCADFGAAHQ
jgi:hypothetical protein